jgi:hypothetical protein
MTVSGWLRRAALGLLLAVVVAALLTARVVADGERALRASDREFDQGNLPDATLYARRAATAYVPGAPHVRAAYERLVAIATGAEASGDRASATAAWRAVRAAELETRHLWVPHPEQLARADQNLARLAAIAAVPDGDARRERRERRQREAAEALARDPIPRAPWLVLLALGFGVAVAGLGIVAARGFAPDGTPVRSGMLWGWGCFAIGAGCWTIAALGA